jgi:hypothetical protein
MDYDRMSDTEASDGEVATLRTTLEEELTRLRDTAYFLRHRLDTVQSLLDQETFELDKHPAQIHPGKKGQAARNLLEALSVQETGLTIGTFLKALNQYLVGHDLVDLNDLTIRPNPLVAKAFCLENKTGAVPYCRLLLSLPALFL